jgi:hypothetical protein
MTNRARGRHSYDSETTGTDIEFFNRNVTPYATEVGSPRFDLVPVQNQKDLMVNAARLHAQQEYDRIMELVEVLQRQAADIRRRLDLTDQVRAAHYDMQLYPGQYYWLVQDVKDSCTRLVIPGPQDWTTGAPAAYQYLCRIQWMGDQTWREVDDREI